MGNGVWRGKYSAIRMNNSGHANVEEFLTTDFTDNTD